METDPKLIAEAAEERRLEEMKRRCSLHWPILERIFWGKIEELEAKEAIGEAGEDGRKKFLAYHILLAEMNPKGKAPLQ